MLIITLKTDQPQAELGLYIGNNKLETLKWHAHRDLSITLHKKIESLLKTHKKSWNNIEGVVCYRGPGSFTGLRIGLSVANALAYGLSVPIVSTSGKSWETTGIKKLLTGENENVALPEYGQEPHITRPKK